MKQILALLSILFVAVFISGCSSVMPMGVLHTKTTLPMQVNTPDSIPKDAKIGTSKSTSYFGLILKGDAGIHKAMENGDLTKVYYVDWQVNNPWWIGLKVDYITTVYGQ